jgi:ferrous iron transport protein B
MDAVFHFFPTTLGFIVAKVIFTGGSALGLSGIQMMGVFYVFVVLLAIFTGLYKSWNIKPSNISLPDLRHQQDR